MKSKAKPRARVRKNASRPDAENPEWTAEEMRRARPALEVLPKEVVDGIRAAAAIKGRKTAIDRRG